MAKQRVFTYRHIIRPRVKKQSSIDPNSPILPAPLQGCIVHKQTQTQISSPNTRESPHPPKCKQSQRPYLSPIPADTYSPPFIYATIPSHLASSDESSPTNTCYSPSCTSIPHSKRRAGVCLRKARLAEHRRMDWRARVEGRCRWWGGRMREY